MFFSTYFFLKYFFNGCKDCVVSLSKNINPGLVLVQPRKTVTCPFNILFWTYQEKNQPFAAEMDE